MTGWERPALYGIKGKSANAPAYREGEHRFEARGIPDRIVVAAAPADNGHQAGEPRQRDCQLRNDKQVLAQFPSRSTQSLRRPDQFDAYGPDDVLIPQALPRPRLCTPQVRL